MLNNSKEYIFKVSYFDNSLFKGQKKMEVRMAANLILPYKLQNKKVAKEKAVVWK